MKLISSFLQRVEEQPERVAHRIAGGGVLTYGMWWQRAEALGATLARTCQPGDRVGLAFARTETLEAAVALFAVWSAGAVPVLVPSDRAVRSDVHEGLGIVGVLDGTGRAWQHADVSASDPYVGADEFADAAIILTSGTEGLPKAVAIPQYELHRDAPEWWSGDVMFNLSPLYTGDALDNLIAPIVDGRLVVSLSSVTGSSFWRAIEEYRPTYLKVVPSMVRLLSTASGPIGTSVTRVGIGSAAVNPNDVAELRKMFPNAEISVDYSSTESGRASLVARADDFETTGWVGELGHPRFRSAVRLVGDDGSVIKKAGVPGDIQLRTPGGRSRRVVSLSGRSTPSNTDGWIAMGDIGEYDENQRLWFRCRSSEVVNVGGEKISLRAIEAALLEIPNIHDAATAEIPHPVLGSAIAAVVVAVQDAPEQAIRDEIGRRFRGADRPHRISFETSVPLNDNGKISRFDVARLVEAAPHPMSPVTEDTFMSLVHSALGDSLALTDSVLDSGASSLALIVLCVDLESKFGVPIDIYEALSVPSFAHLSAAILARQAQELKA